MHQMLVLVVPVAAAGAHVLLLQQPLLWNPLLLSAVV